MPYIPLFEPTLGSPVSPADPHTPNLSASTGSSKHSSIWAPLPLSSPTEQWPDAQMFVSKPFLSQLTPVRAPMPRLPLKIEGDAVAVHADKARSPPGAIGDGRAKAVIERSVSSIHVPVATLYTDRLHAANRSRRAAAQKPAPRLARADAGDDPAALAHTPWLSWSALCLVHLFALRTRNA